LVHVDANGSALGPDLLRRDEYVETTTTAQVDHHFTLIVRLSQLELFFSHARRTARLINAHPFQVGHDKRITATQPKIGFVWYGPQPFLGIAKGPGDICVRLAFIFAVIGLGREACISFVYSGLDISRYDLGGCSSY
jgi:hypothetical protein